MYVHHPYTNIFCNFIEGALRKLVALGKLKREGCGKSTYYLRMR
nr:MAG TPA: Mnd1, Putative tbpip family protein cycle.2A [Caudoviricetes sp.]